MKIDKEKVIKWLKNLAVDVVQAFIIVFILSNFVLVNAFIPTGSMNDTIPTGAKLFASRLSKIFGYVDYGDIIVFKYPDNNDVLFVKRAIGLPGDEVEGRDGEVYVNGVMLEEPYIKDKIKDDFGPYIVPDDSYFVLGDNRLNSKDSRYWNDKFVEDREILGEALFQYYPNFKILR